MSLRSPRHLGTAVGPDGSSLLGYEIVQQKAAALGRAGRRFQQAMEALEAWDAGSSASREGEAGDREREARVVRAAEALWCYVVQREVCGFTDVQWVLREYRVPREVWLRMGPNPERRSGARGGG